MQAKPRTTRRMSAPYCAVVTTRSTTLWALNLGGFIGPFGGQVVIPMLPEIAEAFATSLKTAAWSLSIYTFPLAALLLVSGTLGAKWGRIRTIRAAYVAYAAASLVCAVAPTTAWFLTGRALQGSANAFITPLLVASIYESVQLVRLGRSLGVFASFQAAGMAFAPLAGGIAGAFDYRSAFVVLAVVCVGLAFVRPPGGERPAAEAVEPSRWGALRNRRLVLTAAIGVTFHTTAIGSILLIALLGADRFGLGPVERGMVAVAFGVAGMLIASSVGRLVDRLGVLRMGAIVFSVLAAVVAVAGLAPSVWVLALCSAVAGAAATGSRAIVNTMSVTSTPENRSGAASVTLAFLFLGSALAPVILLPVYLVDAELGFLVAASGAGAAVLLVVLARRLVPQWAAGSGAHQNA